MAYDLTVKPSINGWQNVGTLLFSTNSYQGLPKCKSLTVVNMSSTAAYLHATSDGSTNPTTAANGLPFSTDTAASPGSTITLEGVDLNTTWINTAGSISIVVSVVGG